jgi:hypothetical protein
VDDFSIACSPGILQATPGQSVVTFCAITSIGSFSSPVSVACADLGGLAMCAFAPGSVTPSGGGTALAEVIVRVEPAAKPGCHAFGVAATSGSLSHRAHLRLDVASEAGSSCQGGDVR